MRYAVALLLVGCSASVDQHLERVTSCTPVSLTPLPGGQLWTQDAENIYVGEIAGISWMIERVNKNGGPRETVVEGVQAFVVDDVAFYYAPYVDYLYDTTIIRLNKSGGAPVVLADDLMGEDTIGQDATWIYYWKRNVGLRRVAKTGGPSMPWTFSFQPPEDENYQFIFYDDDHTCQNLERRPKAGGPSNWLGWSPYCKISGAAIDERAIFISRNGEPEIRWSELVRWRDGVATQDVVASGHMHKLYQVMLDGPSLYSIRIDMTNGWEQDLIRLPKDCDRIDLDADPDVRQWQPPTK